MNLLKSYLKIFPIFALFVIVYSAPDKIHSQNAVPPKPGSPYCSAILNCKCGCRPSTSGGACRPEPCGSGGGGGGGGTNPAQPGWYAPEGSACNRTNYHAYFTFPSCAGPVGYITEGITPQSNCSANGSGKCFLATGNTFSQPGKSFWKYDNQTCSPFSIPTTPQNAFDTLYPCTFGIPPASVISGNVTAIFTNSNQFDKIYVWAVDSQQGYSQYIILDKASLKSGQPVPYSFDGLFPDKKYDIYVKAYSSNGVYLDKVNYEGSCGSPGCRSYPNVTFSFKLTFPAPPAGSLTNQVSNEAFLRMIDKWIKGQITPLEMSLFIGQIARVPGLQKITCDPSAGPNNTGCNFKS